MIRYTKGELKTVVKTAGKGKFNVDYRSVKTKHMKSSQGNYVTKVMIDNSFFIATTKSEVIEGLYFYFNSER